MILDGHQPFRPAPGKPSIEVRVLIHLPAVQVDHERNTPLYGAMPEEFC